jgi:hypothetical protein
MLTMCAEPDFYTDPSARTVTLLACFALITLR